MISALSPAAAVQGIIDFKTTEGRKLCAAAAKKLDEETFDCVPEELYQFLKSLANRAQEHGWDNPDTGVLWIPDGDPASEDTNHTNLLTRHGW